MKLWKWQPGRQFGCEYFKFPLWYFKIGRWGFDAYLLRYKPNSVLPRHNDPVDGKHWRLNIPLFGSSMFYWLKDMIWCHTSGPVLFRPDIQDHFLNVYERGCLKISFGFVKFN